MAAGLPRVWAPAVLGRATSIPAHSVLECYSVLTRLPAGHRVTASVAGEVLDRTGLLLLGCPPDVQRTMVRQLASAGIAGGAVYDGLAAATARHHGLPLLTLDRRARATYETLGAAFEMLVHD